MEPVYQGLVKELVDSTWFVEAHGIYTQYPQFPLSVELHQRMALAFVQQRDQAGAEFALVHATKATELAAEDPLSHMVMALALVSGKPKKSEVVEKAAQAEEELQTAFSLQKEKRVKLDSKWDAQGRHLLGTLLLNKAPAEENPQLQEALDYFEDAAALIPEQDHPEEHKMYQASVDACKEYRQMLSNPRRGPARTVAASAHQPRTLLSGARDPVAPVAGR